MYPWEFCSKLWNSCAVAACQISLVSSESIFPHSWLAMSPIIVPLLGGCPCEALTHTACVRRFKLVRWLCQKSVLQASFAKVLLVRLMNNRKAISKNVGHFWKWNCMSSGLLEALFPPKNGIRSNFIASKFPRFSRGACPQTALAVAWLHTTTNLTTSTLMAMTLNRDSLHVVYFMWISNRVPVGRWM